MHSIALALPLLLALSACASSAVLNLDAGEDASTIKAEYGVFDAINAGIALKTVNGRAIPAETTVRVRPGRQEVSVLVLDARLAGTNRYPGFDYRVILITEPRATYTFTPVANRTGGPPSFRLSAAPVMPDGHYFVCKPLTATTFDCGEQVKVPFAP